ncbi:MAG: prepilin-type N-terminal cleavage/methylation domain-containing protein [Kiritimatiellae bacterium]|nr:prepilin-type N-terminal cleavage/methylation domain-containing protein [Kiritimatiellia bacterium]
MKQKMKKGFTLVEIMIVVAIIAILAAVAIPNFLKYRADARSQACVSNMKQLQTAAESWRTTQSDPTAVPAKSDLVGTETTKYIRKEADSFICPEGGEYVIATAEGGAITVTCPNASTHTDHVLK